MCASEQTFSSMSRASDFSGEKQPKSSLVLSGLLRGSCSAIVGIWSMRRMIYADGFFRTYCSHVSIKSSSLISEYQIQRRTRSLNLQDCRSKIQLFQKMKTLILYGQLYSFVFILAGEGGYHIAYLEDMYENCREKKMVKVRWFHRSEELGEMITKSQPNELIMTSHYQIVNAECIDGIATILTPKHYKECLAVVTEDFSDGIYMCSRHIKNDKVSSFPLCKLRGYYSQIVFSVLNLPIGPNKNNQEPSSKEDEKEKEKEKEEGVQSLKEVATIRDDEVEKTQSFRVGEEIEILSQDSGLRGCWFRCKILKVSKKGLKVLYLDVEDAVGPGNLEEWVVADRIAAHDKLGMRLFGRSVIRPSFPIKESSDDGFSIGEAVDAWWCDGWWEGVIVGVGINIHGNNDFHVYFPGENRLQYIEKKHLRASKEWVDKRWIEINPKHDIVSFLTSNVRLHTWSRPSLTRSCSPGANNVAKKSKVLVGSKLKN